MPTIERQGATIHYEVSGEGRPLLLGHSLLCDGRMWAPILPALAARYRVYNIDARGHRASTAPGPFTLWDLAHDWRAILDHERIERAVLCGLSMGGMTAMRFALKAPDRVAGLALLDTSALPQPRAERFRFRAMAEITRRFGFQKLLFPPVKAALFGRTTLRENRPCVDEVIARLRDHDPKALYFAVRAVIERDALTEEIAALIAPTLVLVGEEDKATPPPNARLIAQKIAGAKLVEIPRCGHLSTLEAPGSVTEALLPFLEGLRW